MPTTTNTDSKPDSRVQTDTNLMEIVRPIVSDYVSSSRHKCWAMVEAAYKVKAALGEGPQTILHAINLFRECLTSEYQSSMADFEMDPTFIYDLKLVEKCVKVAYAFTDKELANKRKNQKGFNEIFAEVPKSDNPKKKKKKSTNSSKYAEDLEADAAAGVANADVYAEDVRQGMPVNGLEMKPSKNSKSWTVPEVSGKQTSKTYDEDDWRKESLDIIEDQFDRFLNMIRQALEKELVGSKRQALKELIQ